MNEYYVNGQIKRENSFLDRGNSWSLKVKESYWFIFVDNYK